MPATVGRSIRRAFGAYLVLAGLCGFARSDDTIPKPAVKPGDRWVYHNMDYRFDKLVSTYELQVTFADDKAIHTTVKRQSGSTTDANWTSDWNATVSVMSEAVIYPHSGLFRFPLRIGDRYQSEFEMAHGTVRQKQRHVVKVVGWEDISVPAGTFRALRLDSEGTYERIDRFMVGAVRTSTWYVPEIRRWAKYVYESDVRAGGKVGPYLKIGEELVLFRLH